MEEELTGIRVPCLISWLSCQLFEFRGVFIDEGKLQLQLLEIISCSILLCRVLEPFAEGVQEVFPYYETIVVCGVEGVEEFTKVSHPSGHLFTFDVCQGKGGSSDVRLICRYRPV